MTDYGSYSNDVNVVDFEKDINSVEDFAFNWAAELYGDVIDSSEFLLPDGLTVVSSTFSDTAVTVFLSGGAENITYRVTNRITTQGGRSWDRTIRIRGVER